MLEKTKMAINEMAIKNGWSRETC